MIQLQDIVFHQLDKKKKTNGRETPILPLQVKVHNFCKKVVNFLSEMGEEK